MKTIGLLSGTFDPIHLGHTQLAQAALMQLRLHEVWVLINADPPHKQPLATFAQRLEMARLASREVSGIIADREPIQRQPQAHSLTTAQQLKSTYPDTDFIILMGEDVFAGVKSWDHFNQLRQLVGFAVAKRGSESIVGPPHVEIEMPHLPISSSLVKLHLQGEDATLALHPAVVTYIRQEGLYV